MKDLIEIRWHGRGGQGEKTASLLLADAAFNTGKFIQGFPEYGPERMGAPITAYNRISVNPIRIHSNIYEPDFVVVVDDTLLSSVDVTAGLKKEGAIVINTTKTIDELKEFELIPFINAINDTDMIMTAHIVYPQIEKETYISKKTGKEINLPATLSKTILTDILRKDITRITNDILYHLVSFDDLLFRRSIEWKKKVKNKI